MDNPYTVEGREADLLRLFNELLADFEIEGDVEIEVAFILHLRWSNEVELVTVPGTKIHAEMGKLEQSGPGTLPVQRT